MFLRRWRSSRRIGVSGFRGARIIMTEKDAVQCRHLELEDAWYLPVGFAPSRATRDALDACLSRLFSDTVPGLAKGNGVA